MKVKKLPIVIIILVIILIIIAIQFIYFVREDQQVVLIEFGNMKGSVNEGDSKEAGLHWKAPWVAANTYTKKILRWDGDPDLIPTRPDNQKIFIDTTARWRIIDPKIFYKKLKGSMSEASGRLDDIIDSAVRNVIRSSFFIQVVSSDEEKINMVIEEGIVVPKEIPIEEFEIDYLETLENSEYINFLNTIYTEKEGDDIRVHLKPTITDNERKTLLDILKLIKYNIPIDVPMKGRNQLETEILNLVKKDTMKNFGIEIRDVIIKRVDYNDDNREAAYNRMIAERNKVATEKRSIGLRRKQEIEGEIEQFRRTEISKAYEQAQTLRGEGDAEAAKIYAEAYTDKQETQYSKEDFYEFFIILQAYENLSRKSDVTLSTDSDFFRMLKDMESTFDD
jgi:modulator of FtsH protease HflC